MLSFTECRRDVTGSKLFELCRNVMNIDLDQFPDAECEKSLAYTNCTRIAVNARWMQKKSKDVKYITVPRIVGKEKQTQESRIYKGMPMIAIESKKHKDYEISNAEEFVVVSFTKTEVTLKVVFDEEGEEKIVIIPVVDLPHLMQPGYCLSVHRSQCSSYRVPYTIYQTQKMKKMRESGSDLGKRLLYVALSRATDIKLINISNEY
jgi:ATP-dependent exoDNAse (exonuclease V) alpha subunit